MAFPVKDWRNGEAGGTRLNADALEDMERRLAGYADTRLDAHQAQLDSVETSGPIPVERYCVGDGVADDTGGLRAAIAAGNSLVAGRNTILRITDTITIDDDLTFKSPLTIMFDPNNVLLADPRAVKCFDVTASNVEFGEMTILGPYDEGTLGPWDVNTFPYDSVGINARSSSFVLPLRNIKVKGVTIRNFGSSAVWMENAYDSTVEGCTLEHIGRDACRAYSVKNFVYYDNTIDDIGPGWAGNPGFTNAYGLILTRLDGGLPCNVADVTYNRVSNIPTWEALDTHGGHNITFAFNHITDTASGIVAIPADYGADLGPPVNIEVLFNTFEQVDQVETITAIQLSSTAAAPGRGAKVIGNTFKGYGSSTTNMPGTTRYGAVYVGPFDDVLITNNNFEWANYAHVRLAGGCTNVTVRGNDFGDIVTVESTNSAIQVRNGECQAKIDGNRHVRTTGSYTAYELTESPASGGYVEVGRDTFTGTITKWATGSQVKSRSALNDHGWRGMIAPSVRFGALASTSFGAASARYMRFVPDVDRLIIAVSFVVKTPAGADDQVSVAICDATGVPQGGSGGSGVGAAAVAVSAGVNSIGRKVVSITPVLCKAGVVYYAALSSATPGGAAAVVEGWNLDDAGVARLLGPSTDGATVGLPYLVQASKGSAHPIPATVSIASSAAAASGYLLGLLEV